jgi:O-antigen/teichoic acid export membrane protein
VNSHRTRKLGRDAVTNYLRFAVTASVPFLLTPRMLESFGTEGFGLWSLTHSALSLFGLMDLGLSNTLVRFLSGCRDSEKSNRLVSTVLAIYLGLSAVGLIVLAAMAFLLSPFRDSQEAFTLVWLLGLRNVTVGLPLGVLRSTLHARQLFLVSNLWQSISTAVYGITAWWVLGAGGSLVALAALTLLFALVEHAGYFGLLWRCQEGFRLYPGYLDRAMLGSIASFSASSTLSTLAGLVLLKTDPIIVGLFLPLSAVASYSLALKLAEAVLMLLKQAVNVLAPEFSRLWSGGADQQVTRLYLSACRTALLAGSCLTLPLMFYTPELLSLWLGTSDPETVLTARILLAAAWLATPQMVSSSALSMGGQHGFTARAAAQSAALNLLLSVVLVRVWGGPGVAMATLVTTLLVDLALVTRTACRRLGVERPWREALPLAGPLLVQAGMLYLAPRTVLSIALVTPLSALAGIALYLAQKKKGHL